MQLRKFLFSVAAIVATCNYVGADTLMKGKHPVVIGRGDISGNAIRWTDCDGNEHQQYLKPPYWVDKNDNCKMTPEAFGIEQKDGKYVVVKANELMKYVPGVRNGDEVSFSKVSNGVRLVAGGQKVELHNTIAHDDEYGGLTVAHASAAGCLRRGSEVGEYVLDTEDGHHFSLNSTEQLSHHVGHHVVVGGTIVAKTSESSTTKTPRQMAVSEVHILSSSCSE